MVDIIRNELDELMGKDRNLPIKERLKRKEHYNDAEICKYALVSVCPHDLFPNTKSDLGKCMKRHDELFKKMFDRDDERISFEKNYLNETIRFFESLVSDIDSKIKRAQAKLDTPIPDNDRPKEIQEKLEKYDADIKKLLQDIERLGEEGKIEESEQLDAEIQNLKKKKEDLLKAGDNSLYGLKQMKVCEICGAMQAINDTEKRTQIHLEGKLHTGYAILRKELEKLKKRKDEIKNLVSLPPKEKEKEKEKKKSPSEDKEKKKRSKSKSRNSRKKKEKERSRSRSKSVKKKNKKHRTSSSRSRSKKHSKKDHKKKSRKERSRSKSKSESSLRVQKKSKEDSVREEGENYPNKE